MNLQSGTYYWPTTFPDTPTYPALKEDLSCDVLIIGGGSSVAVDGIPIIGRYEEYPNSYFLFAFGDNGTVYSQMLSKIIVKEIVEGAAQT
ncbi:glycine/D-amino acid oxidase-like deaminating enzyme [Bacillus niacini]|uniref:Glycine/D-amino acid oxidase-like deaminating enzyme n=1 Tax=Neobacillus niacini TaxID=86668 RepID=A0A852THI6_9BACI|nr:glycine/D-amino acid oxidase-like deaminating enzyme [Neobacillus niacini]